MIDIKTYQDLLEVGDIEKDRMNFVLSAIREHQSSEQYKIAKDAEQYASGKNATIMNYQKLLYTLSGKAVPDNYSANHKCASGFFKRFVTQEVAYLLGNGITFENEETKDKLGKNVDSVLYKGAKSALIQSVSFGFYNKDHIEMYGFTEFVPLFDEENGSLMAGIRFWQIDDNKPLRATLYEVDGLTEYIHRNFEQMQVLKEKRPYIQKIVSSVADGDVIYDGADHSKKKAKETREKQLKIGLVFQQFNLFPQYNVLDNVTLAVKLKAKERPDYKQNKKQILAEIDEKALKLLSDMGLSDKINNYPCELSGGQQQRVSIARAMALEPKILFFDEPTSALDPELTGEILKVIRELAKSNMTMVIVTHEMNFAKEVSDYIVFMDDGVIAEEGKAEELINNPKTERLQAFLSKISD